MYRLPLGAFDLRALVWVGIRRMELRDVVKEGPPEGWVTIEVSHTGICGSDLSGYLGENDLRKPPLVMGHEFSGTVRDVGKGVPDGMAGRLVTVNPLLSCGKCSYCLAGDRQLCLDRKVIGIQVPGSFADYVNVPATASYPVTDPVRGALVEPLACAIRAVRHSGVRVGDRALVMGAGVIGLMCARVLAASGASEVAVADVNGRRLDGAKRWWGATDVVDTSGKDADTSLKRLANGGFERVIDAVGHGQTRRLAIESVRRGGTVVFIGLHENDTILPGNVVVRSEIAVKGSFSYADDDFRRGVMLSGNLLDTSGGWMVVRELANGGEAFAELVRGSPFSKILLES